MKLMLAGYQCERCGHQWVKRESTEGDPVICPKCKSPYWNRPRKTVEVPAEVREAIRRHRRKSKDA